MASFSLATSENWKDKKTGERKSNTEWHKIVVFSEGLISLIRSYIGKGSKLYIEGSIRTRKWTDNDNTERYTTEVVLQGFGGEIKMLSSRNEPQVAHNQDKSNGYVPDDVDLDDDIPF